LNDEQAAKMKTLRSNMFTQMKSIHENNSLSGEQKHEQMKALVLQQKEQLKTVLTPGQLQQLENMKKQHHRRDFAK
jgi:periplasmic protein CpxP/Spy